MLVVASYLVAPVTTSFCGLHLGGGCLVSVGRAFDLFFTLFFCCENARLWARILSILTVWNYAAPSRHGGLLRRMKAFDTAKLRLRLGPSWAAFLCVHGARWDGFHGYLVIPTSLRQLFFSSTPSVWDVPGWLWAGARGWLKKAVDGTSFFSFTGMFLLRRRKLLSVST